jgi:NAD(P)-dependent dehydrogenase (short-subunit alcohol dehydrogenase family)
MKPLAVVTGGTRGIGAGISEHLYRRGYHVAAVYRADDQAAGTLAKALTTGEGEFFAYRLDMADADRVEQLAQRLNDTYGPAMLLVNNAGSISRPSYWREQSLPDAHATVQGNLGITLNAVWAFAPHMIANGTGRIVNISSTYAELGEAHILAYSAAKAGLNAITKGLARDLGPAGITVNTVSPAVVVTAMTAAAGDEFIESSRRRTPTRTLATAADIARCVEFLVDNPIINGVDLPVDGGLHMVGP